MILQTFTLLPGETPEQVAEELLRIMVNMRFAENYWQEHYGSQANKARKEWQASADKYLQKHGITLLHDTRKVFINK